MMKLVIGFSFPPSLLLSFSHFICNPLLLISFLVPINKILTISCCNINSSYCFFKVITTKNPSLRPFNPQNPQDFYQIIIISTNTNTNPHNNTRVKILSEALPFIQRFRGKTVVVKYGGAAMKSKALQASVIADLVLLSCIGLRIVFVHGGGPEINQWLNRLGIQSSFFGLRVTDVSTMEIVSMVLVGKMGGYLLLCFVGEITSVDTSVLEPLVKDGYIPVIASVAADGTGQSYNINADTATGELAVALGAEKLLLTDVAGILGDKDDPGSLVKEIDVGGVRRMIDDGKIAGGMIPKVSCCVKAFGKGVKTARIIDGRLDHSLLLEILTGEGAGKMITG
ncbi:putative acetylglutamate kinase [Helianthus annuus]|uniref:Acetylglutamate kinase n=1 Tax=Helianthus annuus TaxID=4232 RepID=A0A251TBX8_HELAN|nr:putative acetylglutamate kinase [Helianthus annuus]KAF5782645.1 putative acetylglutamate kinase [Helianthus annuus]KAJ0502115.1 putative acetylglutamate kinase [Helianthus annuus]KAJ0502116.1 putative acetylglutamate kinase [Helianthus annuus]KAJ0510084.1 putative acetylglutamate kinase [Helianthus annuus]